MQQKRIEWINQQYDREGDTSRCHRRWHNQSKMTQKMTQSVNHRTRCICVTISMSVTEDDTINQSQNTILNQYAFTYDTETMEDINRGVDGVRSRPLPAPWLVGSHWSPVYPRYYRTPYWCFLNMHTHTNIHLHIYAHVQTFNFMCLYISWRRIKINLF